MSQDDLDLYPEQADEFISPAPIPDFDEDKMDEDEQMLAKEEDLPSESGEEREEEKEALTAAMPVQEDEFVCSLCYLVKHKSQLAKTEGKKLVCRECAYEN
ncbi:MAG: DUF4193 family protein [Aeriscardovia sp.]|nr:DUF4193 family protein [Aeriscardovia sp.]